MRAQAFDRLLRDDYSQPWPQRPPVTPSIPIAPRKRRGRRPSHTEHWSKVTVVLLDRQVISVDRLAAGIRAVRGVAIRRAHIIRALIDALTESDVDLTVCCSETELKTVLSNRLRRSQQPALSGARR